MSLLITGAAGGVARMLRPYLRDRFGPLILSDLVAPDDLHETEEFRRADLGDAAAVARAMSGAKAAIHLGGVSTEQSWEAVHAANILGAQIFFDCARKEGIERVIFASSNHVAGFHPRTPGLPVTTAMRPDGFYGVSKVFGEALAALYADKFGMRTLSIRIGNVAPEPVDRRRLSIWLHPEDLAQLCEIGLTHPDIHNQIVWGASDNVRGWWDNSAASALGYAPRHRSEDYSEAVLTTDTSNDAIADAFQGGDFTASGFAGDLERTKSH